MKVCSVSGCFKKHVAKGYCQNHYRVFKRNGTATPHRQRKTWAVTGGYLMQVVKGETRYIHIDVAERALGRSLPGGAEIHHIDGDPANNSPSNLVICPNHEYHMLLHQRARALDVCGHADWRPCQICGIHDDPTVMRPHRKQFYHRACLADQSRERRARIKGENEWPKQSQ